MSFLGHGTITIKWGSGKFFPNIGNWLTPTIKDKKLTYYISSFKVKTEKKHAFDFDNREKL